MEIASKFGIELTYQTTKALFTKFKKEILKKYDINYIEYNLSSGNLFREICELEKIKVYHVSADGGVDTAFELATPKFKTFNELELWYKKWDKVIKNSPYSATWDPFIKTNKVWEGSGGGHIHFNIPYKNIKKKALFILNVMRYASRYPWFNWVFNEWCDDDNANSMLEVEQLKLSEVLDVLEINDNDDYNYNWSIDYLCACRLFVVDGVDITSKKLTNIFLKHSNDIGKDYAVRYDEDKNTMELRFFDAPKDFNQLKEHLAIGNIIIKDCIMMTDNNEYIQTIKYNNMSEYLKDRPNIFASVKHELADFCASNNLEFNDYKKYLDNLKLRIKYGRLV